MPDLKIQQCEAGKETKMKYAYLDGYLTEKEAIQELIDKGIADYENEAYWIAQEWDTGDCAYEEIFDTVLNGGDFAGEMARLTERGKTESQVIGQVKSEIGEWYKTGKITRAQTEQMLDEYCEMSKDEIKSVVNKWSSTVVVGIDYEDIESYYVNGKITAQRAADMYVLYGGMTEKEAQQKITVIDFVQEHPRAKGISYNTLSNYLEYCEPKGVEVETFYEVYKHASNAESDKDEHGNVISGSKKEKVLEYINSLDLTKKQKDSIYYAMGYAQSNLYQAPWR
jgi:hypothetical protein